ncbi:MAG: hypothetical protein A3F26_03310 [Candidatus Ryanbacteria bacterium RIFCSPHIGHO2_12_FULL_47_12b]|nr:MAG: hypothetical protein A3F26_03310 [Candidatus Ryanbacteria bacterium RIFCSPHIGHO2_12_FULL_47_12b]
MSKKQQPLKLQIRKLNKNHYSRSRHNQYVLMTNGSVATGGRVQIVGYNYEHVLLSMIAQQQ